jgi:hypothetical protein
MTAMTAMTAFATSRGPNGARRRRHLSAGHDGARSMAIDARHARHIMYSMHSAALHAPQALPSHGSPSRSHAADLVRPPLNPARAPLKSP